VFKEIWSTRVGCKMVVMGDRRDEDFRSSVFLKIMICGARLSMGKLV